MSNFSKNMLLLILMVIFVILNDVSAAKFSDIIAGGGAAQSDPTGDGPPAQEPIPTNLKAVVKCKLGTPHSRYPACRCGEHAVQVPKHEIPPENLAEYHVKRKENYKGQVKLIYYFCLFCSMCPDGVRTLTNCSQVRDTQCTANECVDPTHIFDWGRKACIEDPMRALGTVEVPREENVVLGLATGSEPANRLQPGEDVDRTDGATPLDPGEYPPDSPIIMQDTLLLIGVCVLIFVFIIVLIVNVWICRYFLKRREIDKELESIISRAPSRASFGSIIAV